MPDHFDESTVGVSNDDPADMEEAIEFFHTTATTVKKAIVNFGKDGASRKSDPTYFSKKLVTFTKLYDELDQNYINILQVDHEKTHPFFITPLESIYTTPDQLLEEAKKHLDLLKNPPGPIPFNIAQHILSSLSPHKQRTNNATATSSDSNRDLNSIIAKLTQEKDELTLQVSELFIQLETSQEEITKLKQANRELRLANHILKLDSFQINPDREQQPTNISTTNSSIPPRNKITDIIKLIPKFNGKPEDLRVYLNKIDDLFSYIDNCDEALFVTVVKTNLTGEAANEIAEEEGLDTWDELKAKLTTSFKQKENHVNDIALLQQTRQGQSETVELFCARIKKVLTKLKSVIPAGTTRNFWFAHSERYALQCLEDGLSDVKIQARLVAEKPKTFQAAVQFVIDTECRLNKNKNATDTSRGNTIKDSGAQSVPTCTYCRKKGHKIEDCRIKNKNPSAEKSEKKFRCEICDRDTHTTAICYKNPKNKKPADTKVESPEKINNISIQPAITDDESIENDTWLTSEN